MFAISNIFNDWGPRVTENSGGGFPKKNLCMQCYLLKSLFEKACYSQEASAAELPSRCVWCTVNKG